MGLFLMEEIDKHLKMLGLVRWVELVMHPSCSTYNFQAYPFFQAFSRNFSGGFLQNAHVFLRGQRNLSQ